MSEQDTIRDEERDRNDIPAVVYEMMSTAELKARMHDLFMQAVEISGVIDRLAAERDMVQVELLRRQRGEAMAESRSTAA